MSYKVEYEIPPLRSILNVVILADSDAEMIREFRKFMPGGRIRKVNDSKRVIDDGEKLMCGECKMVFLFRKNHTGVRCNHFGQDVRAWDASRRIMNPPKYETKHKVWSDAKTLAGWAMWILRYDRPKSIFPSVSTIEFSFSETSTNSKEEMLKPIGDQIIVKADSAQSQSSGGIILPANSQERPTLGTVMAVGRGHLLQSGQLVPLEVEPGDRIAYKMYGGVEAEVGDQKFLVVKEADVLFAIRAEPTEEKEK